MLPAALKAFKSYRISGNVVSSDTISWDMIKLYKLHVGQITGI